MPTHDNHLQRAITLAAANVENGGRPFGAVIVRHGEVIAEAVNTLHQSGDPTAHAELNAIRDVFTLPASGITEGARPVLSYNYGAGQMQRVRAGIRFMSAAAMVYTFCAWLFAMFQPRLLCRIFTPDEAMVEASVRMLRVYFAGFFFQSFQFCGQSVFQSLGWAKYAITFSLLRKVVIVVPLTLLLPVVGLGTTGVFLAEPISNIVGGLACYITMLCTAYKQMGRE